MRNRSTSLPANSVGTIRLIAGRELHARLRTKSFAAGTVLILLVLVGLIQLTIIGAGA